MENKQVTVEGLLQQIVTQLNGTKGVDQLAAAYVQAWAELDNVVKNANNPHFGSDYADLTAVLDTVKPVFSKFGLAIMGPVPGNITDGNMNFTTLLIHSSGQHFIFNGSIPLGGKLTAQAAGSAITYFRRYTNSAIAGIAQKDDDGEAASSPSKAPKSDGGEPTYGESVARAIVDIEKFTGSYEELEANVRPWVEQMADEQVNAAYVAKRKTLKKAKK